MEDKIAIYLTPEEAETFKKFRKYQNEFELFLQSGLFTATNSTIEINYSQDGQVMNIFKQERLYKRKMNK